MEICAPEASRASRALRSVESGYGCSLQFTSRAAFRGIWAVYKKRELTDLLSVIGDHVATLEKLFPEQERNLAAQEVASMDRDAIAGLAPIVTTSDPVLAVALREEAHRKGFTYDNIATTGNATPRKDRTYYNITTTDNATAHLGDRYQEVPENEGRPSWTDIKRDGNAFPLARHHKWYQDLRMQPP